MDYKVDKQKALNKKYVKDIKSADVWSVFKILADFVQGFDELGDLGPSVTIFGSARTAKESEFYEKAVTLADKLGERGFNVITGGGPGIMEAANKGAFNNPEVESIGLNIDLPMEQTPNPYTTKEKTFDYFFSRKVMLVKYSMAYVIFPGGFGTLDELFESLTLVQTGKVKGVKIFVIGVEYYSPLIEFIKTRLLRDKMVDKDDLDIITLTDDLEFVAKEIEKSLEVQMGVLEDEGLANTKYYKALSGYFKHRHIKDGKDS